MSQNELMLHDNLFEDLTPSSAIDHMIAGIERFSNHPNFGYDMVTFGANASKDYQSYYGIGEFPDGAICVGCLATTTIFTIMGEEPNENNIYLAHHPKNGYTAKSVREFEYAVNALRCYGVKTYLTYFNANDRSLYLTIEEIDEITEELFAVIGEKRTQTIIQGHPNDDQLAVFIVHLMEFQAILKNHNL